MKKLLLLFTCTLFLLNSCSSDDENPKIDPPKSYTTITGNTYHAKSWRFSDHRTTYEVYKFNNDGTIDIVENFDSPNGELYEKGIGTYEYSHPELKLKIQSVSGCENCFNNFTATVSDDRRSFTYQVYDISIGAKRSLDFKISE